jgi:hypothetical protein
MCYLCRQFLVSNMPVNDFPKKIELTSWTGCCIKSGQVGQGSMGKRRVCCIIGPCYGCSQVLFNIKRDVTDSLVIEINPIILVSPRLPRVDQVLLLGR